MKKILILAGTILLAAMLAACSPGIHGKIGYNVDFQNGELVFHAPNQPNAYIDAGGSLRIGDRKIAVTPQQRGLLKAYYGESEAVLEAGIATGKAGVKLGAHAVGNAIASIFSGDSNQAANALDAQTNAVEASARKICVGINRLHDIQQAIAVQLPAFKPYQAFAGQTHCDVTTTGSSITVTQTSSGPAKSGEPGEKAMAH